MDFYYYYYYSLSLYLSITLPCTCPLGRLVFIPPPPPTPPFRSPSLAPLLPDLFPLLVPSFPFLSLASLFLPRSCPPPSLSTLLLPRPPPSLPTPLAPPFIHLYLHFPFFIPLTIISFTRIPSLFPFPPSISLIPSIPPSPYTSWLPPLLSLSSTLPLVRVSSFLFSCSNPSYALSAMNSQFLTLFFPHSLIPLPLQYSIACAQINGSGQQHPRHAIADPELAIGVATPAGDTAIVEQCACVGAACSEGKRGYTCENMCCSAKIECGCGQGDCSLLARVLDIYLGESF